MKKENSLCFIEIFFSWILRETLHSAAAAEPSWPTMPCGTSLLAAMAACYGTTRIETECLEFVNSSEPFAETVQPWALLSRVSREEHLFGNSRGWIWDRYDIEGLIRPETLSLFKKIVAWSISVTKHCAESVLESSGVSRRNTNNYGQATFVFRPVLLRVGR